MLLKTISLMPQNYFDLESKNINRLNKNFINCDSISLDKTSHLIISKIFCHENFRNWYFQVSQHARIFIIGSVLNLSDLKTLKKLNDVDILVIPINEKNAKKPLHDQEKPTFIRSDRSHIDLTLAVNEKEEKFNLKIDKNRYNANINTKYKTENIGRTWPETIVAEVLSDDENITYHLKTACSHFIQWLNNQSSGSIGLQNIPAIVNTEGYTTQIYDRIMQIKDKKTTEDFDEIIQQNIMYFEKAYTSSIHDFIKKNRDHVPFQVQTLLEKVTKPKNKQLLNFIMSIYIINEILYDRNWKNSHFEGFIKEKINSILKEEIEDTEKKEDENLYLIYEEIDDSDEGFENFTNSPAQEEISQELKEVKNINTEQVTELITSIHSYEDSQTFSEELYQKLSTFFKENGYKKDIPKSKKPLINLCFKLKNKENINKPRHSDGYEHLIWQLVNSHKTKPTSKKIDIKLNYISTQNYSISEKKSLETNYSNKESAVFNVGFLNRRIKQPKTHNFSKCTTFSNVNSTYRKMLSKKISSKRRSKNKDNSNNTNLKFRLNKALNVRKSLSYEQTIDFLSCEMIELCKQRQVGLRIVEITLFLSIFPIIKGFFKKKEIDDDDIFKELYLTVIIFSLCIYFIIQDSKYKEIKELKECSIKLLELKENEMILIEDISEIICKILNPELQEIVIDSLEALPS